MQKNRLFFPVLFLSSKTRCPLHFANCQLVCDVYDVCLALFAIPSVKAKENLSSNHPFSGATICLFQGWYHFYLDLFKGDGLLSTIVNHHFSPPFGRICLELVPSIEESQI